MGIVKWLRPWVVVPVFVGSNPITHPNDVGASPSGKAMDSDSIMRRFESCRPSQVEVEHKTIIDKRLIRRIFLNSKADN